MEINRQQSTPNFGMALKFETGAKKFLEEAPAEVRQFFAELGPRIKNSKNDIWVNSDGTVQNTYEPCVEDFRLVTSEEQRKALDEADAIMRKKLKSIRTPGETFDIYLEVIKTYLKVGKIKMFSSDHPLLKKGRIAEAWQRLFDKSDALDAKLEQRLKAKEEVAKAETEQLMQLYGQKELNKK